MKNVLYLFITCIISTATFAQAQIDRDFQGNWKLSEISAGGVRIDLVKSIITLSKDRENKMSAQEKATMESKKGEFIKNLSQSHILVNGKNVDFVMGNLSKRGTYALEKYSDAYKLEVAYEDGSNDTLIMYIKDKKLHITKSDDVDRDEMIFTHD